MAYWLLKTEPDDWSWDEQVAKGKKGEIWTGVRNAQARNFIREMKKGDLAFFYHTGGEKQVVGVVKVTKEAYQDPTTDDERWVVVDVVAVEALAKPVTHLPESIHALGSGPLLQQGIEGCPILDIAGLHPSKLQRPVMRLRRERDDQVIEIIRQLIEGFGPVPGNIDAQFPHHLNGHRVDLAAFQPDAVDIEARACQLLQQALGHWRADRILGTAEQDAGAAARWPDRFGFSCRASGDSAPLGHTVNPGCAGRKEA